MYKRIKQVLIICCLILMSYSLCASDNVEQAYDAKIKAMQAEKGTFIVGTAIGDFNWDGVKDLVVSQLTVYDSDGYASGYIENIGFTYKNGKIVRVAIEDSTGVVSSVISGTGTPWGLVAQVSSSDGKKSLLKVCSGCSYGETVEYLKLNEKSGKWEKYIRSNTTDKQGYGHNEWEKNNNSITKKQYKKEISYYPNMNTLYVYTRTGRIRAKANKYNKIQKEVAINSRANQEPWSVGSYNVYLSYVKSPYFDEENDISKHFDLKEEVTALSEQEVRTLLNNARKSYTYIGRDSAKHFDTEHMLEINGNFVFEMKDNLNTLEKVKSYLGKYFSLSSSRVQMILEGLVEHNGQCYLPCGDLPLTKYSEKSPIQDITQIDKIIRVQYKSTESAINEGAIEIATLVYEDSGWKVKEFYEN